MPHDHSKESVKCGCVVDPLPTSCLAAKNPVGSGNQWLCCQVRNPFLTSSSNTLVPVSIPGHTQYFESAFYRNDEGKGGGRSRRGESDEADSYPLEWRYPDGGARAWLVIVMRSTACCSGSGLFDGWWTQCLNNSPVKDRGQDVERLQYLGLPLSNCLRECPAVSRVALDAFISTDGTHIVLCKKQGLRHLYLL